MRKLSRYAVSSDAVMVLSGVLPRFSKMRHLSLEFTGFAFILWTRLNPSSCRLEELEINILSYGFKQCTQIERLTFKLIQYESQNVYQIINRQKDTKYPSGMSL